MSVAALILAHNQPEQVRRLIRKLDGLDTFLHVDAESNLSDFYYPNHPGRIDAVLTPRYRTPRRRFGAVDAEIAGLRTVLRQSDAEHIIVMSGSCYPLVSMYELRVDLAKWDGLTRTECYPIPYWRWNESRIKDGGLHRMDRRFLSWNGRMVLVKGDVPIPLWRRRVPHELQLTASSQWKVYARDHVKALLYAIDTRPDIMAYWRTTFIPQESCLTSILKSPALVGPEVPGQVVHDLPWFIDWDRMTAGGHPGWLTAADYPEIVKSGKLFARKIRDPELLALIDSA
jgi:hypothetical protein